jgi:hypothetical protein
MSLIRFAPFASGARHLIFELVIVSDSASGIILRSAEVAAFAFHRALFLNVHKIRVDSDNKR